MTESQNPIGISNSLHVKLLTFISFLHQCSHNKTNEKEKKKKKRNAALR